MSEAPGQHATQALLEDQAARWRRGERVPVEDYLGRQPALAEDSEAVLELIAHEVILRQDRGESPALAEYQQRFPHLAEPLEAQFEVDAFMRSALTVLPSTVGGGPAAPAGPGIGEALPGRLGRYRIVARLGAGGMGVVYRAHDSELRRDVAVKAPFIRGTTEAWATARQRFLREARAAAALRHPNVCPIYDVGEDAGRPYVVMALVEGESLGDRLRRQGRFEDAGEAVALVAQVADGLAAVHVAGVIHRDVKPGNVLLDRSGVPLLSDFGLARAEDGEHLSGPGDVLGTPAYMAPEQAAPELGPVGPWSDQYSLGAVLYHLLAGRPPFEGTPLSVIYQVGTAAVPPPSRFRPDLSPALEGVLLKALARQPRDRYPSVGEFAAALRACKERPAPAGPARAAQQRRLTLLSCGCDLFESEALLTELDAEEQHDLLQDFRQLCRDVAAPLGGAVVKATDSGLLVCFGAPFALEGAARRAVRAGLSLLERLAPLNERLGRQRPGLRLSARAAAHSDRAVVTESGGPGEPLSIVGPVLAVVDQLERLAAPDTVVISEDTHRLLRGLVECTSLGTHQLKGAGAKVVHRADRELAAGSGVDGAGLGPLVGRDREVALLQERWEQAVEGEGQVVLLVGEAGIGKSRLVRALREHVSGGSAGGRAALVVEWPCTSLQEAEGHRFHASESFARTIGIGPGDGPAQKREKLVAHLEELHLAGAEAIALLASLLSIPLDERHPPLGLSPQRQKEKTFELQLDWLRAQAQRQPVLFVVEDLHWAGPNTLEFLDLLVGQAPTPGLLTLLTYRPELVPPWRARGHHTQVPLSRLTRRHTGELMLLRSGLPAIPPGVLAQVAERSDGVPLFVEELTAVLLEAGALRVVGGEVQATDAFDAQAIPATLQDLLMARLDRLASDLEVVQLAAAIGREFSHELLAAAAPCGEEALQQELAKLVEAGLLFQQGRPPAARYQFKHALIRDAAYQTLLKKKRQQLHLRIAEALERRFPVACAGQPDLLAHHFTEGNEVGKAVVYWERAGTQAQRAAAPAEAAGHFRRGLGLIEALPETPERQAQEIALQVGLGAALQATRGYSAPEVEAACARAHALCRQTGLTAKLFPALQGLCRHSFQRARYARARELAEDMLRLPDLDLTPGFAVAARYALGATLYQQGEPIEALSHLEKAVAVEATAEVRSASSRHDVLDPWVIAQLYLARALWLLGHPERAVEECRRAVTTAEGLNHPFSLCYALSCAAWLHQMRQDRESAGATASRALALATEKGFPIPRGWARALSGWALAEGERAVAEVRAGLASLHAQGSELNRSSFLSLLAEACARAGRWDEGLKALDEAQEVIDATGEALWQAEVHRLRGELLLQLDAKAVQEAEACFAQALEVARRQQARSLELRAALSLGRLWEHQGQAQAGRELVAAVYGTFTEGLEAPELQAARAWLERGGPSGA
jgi:class 3 adenylate cyclase/predicted ATPase